MKVTAFPNVLDELPRLPADIVQSARVFNATCGPISLAALFSTFVCEVMKFFPDFPKRQYTTTGDMEYALEQCGAAFRPFGPGLPETGLSLVQLEGPWTRPGAPIRAQLCHTHWIASRGRYVFDPNLSDWVETQNWLEYGSHSWMKNIKRCTGFRVRHSFAIVPESFQFSPFGRVETRPRRRSNRQ